MMNEKIYHQPVMLEESLEGLALKDTCTIVDVTCGEGGHSLEILKKIPKGRLICIDRDPEILEKAKVRLSDFPQAVFHNNTFDKITSVLSQEKLNKVDGILADLGISMFHLKGHEDSETNRALGFSYTDTASLDMRLGVGADVTAETVVNRFREEEIADILYKYGEEYESRKIAREIVRHRPIKNASELANVILRAKMKKGGKAHPATKTFQALRIFVNKELEILESFIPQAADNLSENGRLVVISYHSLEDRIVKQGFRKLLEEGKGIIVTKKPLTAAETEIAVNRAARSAKLRIFEKRSSLDGKIRNGEP